MTKPQTKILSTVIGIAVLPSFVHASDETMVVTATGFEQKINNAPASITVITKQEIEDKAWRDITDALKDVPGIVVTDGASNSDISIRGMSAKYTLFLVNGKRISTRDTRPNSDNSGIEQGWLPPLESIERIEIIRGPMSSLYGSDAMGGVINIITKKISTTRAWTGSLHADATHQQHHRSGDLLQTDAYASGPLINGLLGASVTGLFSRRAEDKIINGFSEQRMRDGGITLNLTPDDKNDFDFSYTRELQERNGTPGKTIASQNCRGQVCTPSRKSEDQYQHSTYTLSHNGYYTDFNSTSYIQREETHNPRRQMRSYNTTFNNQNQIFLNDHTLTLGGQYLYEKLTDHTSNRLNNADALNQLTRWSWALFTEDEWAITESVALTAGLRMNKDQNYGTHWTPRGYGIWHLTDNWTLKGGVSAGYRAPDLRQSSAGWGQATGGSRLNGIIIGNPDLSAEKSLSEELALLWDNHSDLNASVTLFTTQFKDKITEVRRCSDRSDPRCTLGHIQYDFISDRINVDKADMRGAEATFGWKITRDINWTTNYTYTHSEQKSGQFSGKPLNKMPGNMLNTLIDWQTTPTFGLWGRLNFRGKTSEYLSRTSMAQGTPSYTQVDLGLRYQASKHLLISAGIYNTLDKKIDYADYDTVLDGRRYTAGITYSF